MKNSSDNTKIHTLAGATGRCEARKFLYELANLRDEPPAAERFKRHWGPLFLPEVPCSVVHQWSAQGEEDCISAEQELQQYWLLPLRDYVRYLWLGDPRTKQFGIFLIVEKFLGVGFRGPVVGPWTSDLQWFQGKDLPPESDCERVFRHLADCTAVCQNIDCLAPYFFATRRGQKYCSEECAKPAQREFKNNWWKEKGTAWRASRAATVQQDPSKVGDNKK